MRNGAQEMAIDYAWGRGVVVVAAAGNGATGTSGGPTMYPEQKQGTPERMATRPMHEWPPGRWKPSRSPLE